MNFMQPIAQVMPKKEFLTVIIIVSAGFVFKSNKNKTTAHYYLFFFFLAFFPKNTLEYHLPGDIFGEAGKFRLFRYYFLSSNISEKFLQYDAAGIFVSIPLLNE